MAPSTSGGVSSTRSPNHGRLGLGSACFKKKISVRCLGSGSDNILRRVGTLTAPVMNPGVTTGIAVTLSEVARSILIRSRLGRRDRICHQFCRENSRYTDTGTLTV
jgi:hypothetical protein